MKIGREYTNRVILNDIYTSHIELLFTKLILIIHPFKIKFFSSNSFFSRNIFVLMLKLNHYIVRV